VLPAGPVGNHRKTYTESFASPAESLPRRAIRSTPKTLPCRNAAPPIYSRMSRRKVVCKSTRNNWLSYGRWRVRFPALLTLIYKSSLIAAWRNVKVGTSNRLPFRPIAAFHRHVLEKRSRFLIGCLAPNEQPHTPFRRYRHYQPHKHSTTGVTQIPQRILRKDGRPSFGRQNVVVGHRACTAAARSSAVTGCQPISGRCRRVRDSGQSVARVREEMMSRRKNSSQLGLPPFRGNLPPVAGQTASCSMLAVV